MPEIRLPGVRLQVTPGANLLQALLDAGQPAPYSCRAGACHACLVRAEPYQVPAAASQMLDSDLRSQGWLLSCQCNVEQDMDLDIPDPSTSATAARLVSRDLLEPDLLRLRVKPERPFRYRAGQHLVLWLGADLGRPYSITSLPGEEHLEFHVRLRPGGRFSQAVTQLNSDAQVWIGKASGALTYDPAWHGRPLLLLAKGTGLGPLLAVARQALDEAHGAPIAIWHWSRTGRSHLASELATLAARCPELSVHERASAMLEEDLRQLRPASRATMALVCGSPEFTEQLRRPLFMAGLPGRQIMSEAFLSGARPAAPEH
jgi:ferredoxin-NADP reductase/ferredoxin